MSVLHSWLWKQNGAQCDWAYGEVNELGGTVIPGTKWSLQLQIIDGCPDGRFLAEVTQQIQHIDQLSGQGWASVVDGVSNIEPTLS